MGCEDPPMQFGHLQLHLDRFGDATQLAARFEQGEERPQISGGGMREGRKSGHGHGPS
jgi:hypothetical protein